MRGRTVFPINTSSWKSTSYVQINIYDTNLQELQEEGVDIKHILQHIGYRSVVMEVPILADLQSSARQPCARRVKSFSGFYGACGNKEGHQSAVATTEATVSENIGRGRLVKEENDCCAGPIKHEDLGVDEVAVNEEFAVDAMSTSSFGIPNSVSDEHGGPLTSTPMTDKRGSCFEDFIGGRSCSASGLTACPNPVKA
ncbi:hypothetical protein COOONC_08239 [Cooperia oncophora]